MKVSEKAAAQSQELQRDQNLRIATQLQQDFERRAEGLEFEIRERVSDPSHVAYSMCEEITRILEIRSQTFGRTFSGTVRSVNGSPGLQIGA